jgi:urease accessory protein UreF
MNATVDQSLISRIQALSPEQVAEVESFVEFLSAKMLRRAAIDRLLAIAPALEAAGVEPMSMEEINSEVKAARAERRARRQGSSGAHRS